MTEDNPSIQSLYAAGDYRGLWGLHIEIASLVNGEVRWLPIQANGRPDFEAVRFSEGREPKTIQEARRLCVIASRLAGCHPSTEILLHFAENSGESPFVRQIAGPTEDSEIAALVAYRSCGWRPRMVPLLPKEPVEPPIAANDNLPPAPAMCADPYEPEAAGGLLADVTRWITETAIFPVPELSMTAAIALLAGIFGRRALTPTSAGINMYMTTLLGTAGGKAHPPKAIRAIADSIGAMGAVTNGDPTSYAAIERILRKNPSTVISMDEFGITLQDVNAKSKNAVAAGIRKMLLAVYDQANSVFDGRVYASADTKKDEAPIIGPALTVLAMTTVDTLYAGLSEASIADGFLNRFLFITAKGSNAIVPAPRLSRNSKPPASLIEAVKTAVTSFPSGTLPLAPKYVVPFDGDESGDAYARWAEIFTWQQLAGANLAGRAAENTIRLATIRAISRDAASPSVNVEDVEWAWALVHASIRLMVEGVRLHLSASPAEALRKAIVAAIEDTPDRMLAYSKLLMRAGVRSAELRDVESALNWLLESGTLSDVNAKPRPGRGSKFRLAA